MAKYPELEKLLQYIEKQYQDTDSRVLELAKMVRVEMRIPWVPQYANNQHSQSAVKP